MHFACGAATVELSNSETQPSDLYMKHPPHWCNFIIHLNLSGPVQNSEISICVKKFIEVHLCTLCPVQSVLGLFHGGKAAEVWC